MKKTTDETNSKDVSFSVSFLMLIVVFCCFKYNFQIQFPVFPHLTGLIKPSRKGVALAGVKLFNLSKWDVKGFKALKISSCFLSAIQERLEKLPGC